MADIDAFEDYISSLHTSGPSIRSLKQQMSKKGRLLFKILIGKYPTFTWVEKYVDAGRVSMVPELGLLYFCTRMLSERREDHFDAFWTYEATAELCKSLLDKIQVPITTQIRLREGAKHIILVVGYDDGVLLVNDPLGDYHTNYKDSWGVRVSFTHEEIESIGTGKPLSVYFPVPSIKRSAAVNLLGSRKYFHFSVEEIAVLAFLGELGSCCKS